MRTLRKLPAADDNAAASPDYVGTYWSDDLGVDYRIDLVDGALQVWHRKIGSRPLVPRAPDRFSVPGMQITFTRDGRGRVTGFTGSAGRVRQVRFDRR